MEYTTIETYGSDVLETTFEAERFYMAIRNGEGIKDFHLEPDQALKLANFILENVK